MNYKKHNQTINWLIYLAIIIGTLEVSPFILSPLVLNQSFHRSTIRNEIGFEKQKDTSGTFNTEEARSEYLGEHILHPYIGYVHIPGGDYNVYGFPGTDPLDESDSNALTICITGGSVAKQLILFQENYIINKLKQVSQFAGKEIKLFTLALGGFKQPQQLLALNYFMANGAHFDYIINLDGFNEIVLPLSDNHPFGVNPAFPRHWNIYARKKLDSKVMQQMGKKSWMIEQQEIARLRMQKNIWRYSNFALFIWKISNLNYSQKVLTTENKLREVVADSGKDMQATGPDYPFADTLSFLKQQATMWAQSSQQLNSLVNGSGGRYLHFLQPNQYDTGSKPLTEEEMDIAYEPGPFAYKTAARLGYPLLREKESWLLENGVRFVDLSGMFAQDQRTLYSDKCCHFNALGYRLIADRILVEIINERIIK